MARLTLGKALPLLATYAVSGACTTDPRVIEKINEARERIMTKPEKWKGKTQRFVFCVNRGCVTLPREILTIEAIAVGCSPFRIKNQWYELLEGGPGPQTSSDCGSNMIDRGDGFATFADPDEAMLIKVYADVPEAAGTRILLQGFDENGNRVRTYDETEAAWVDGEYVAINNTTPATSTNRFLLDGIQKPQTNGFVRLYTTTVAVEGVAAIDETVLTTDTGTELNVSNVSITGTEEDQVWVGSISSDGSLSTLSITPQGGAEIPQFAINSEGGTLQGTALIDDTYLFSIEILPGYDLNGTTFTITRTYTPAVIAVPAVQTPISILHPDDELPSYRRYFIPALDTEDDTVRQVVVMATLRYLPVSQNSDWLNIEHIGALKNMLLGLNAEEKGDLAAALAYEANCMRMLAGEVANYVGDSAQGAMQVETEAFGAGEIYCPL